MNLTVGKNKAHLECSCIRQNSVELVKQENMLRFFWSENQDMIKCVFQAHVCASRQQHFLSRQSEMCHVSHGLPTTVQKLCLADGGC